MSIFLLETHFKICGMFKINNNYLLTGKKVKLFSRDKPEIFYCSSEARTIIVRGFVEGKTLFYQLIRNFLFKS